MTPYRNHLGLTAVALFVGAIVLANYVTSEYGLIPVGFGLTATAGTYFAGITFVLRDAIDDLAGRIWVAVAILTGAAISFPVAHHFTNGAFLPPGVTVSSVVLASGIAFLLSESADWAVYTPLRRHGYLRAALASNAVGTVVDSLLFLSIAGFGITGSVFAGQVVGKTTITLAAALLVKYGIATARQDKRA